jgi:hypothetical protein
LNLKCDTLFSNSTCTATPRWDPVSAQLDSWITDPKDGKDTISGWKIKSAAVQEHAYLPIGGAVYKLNAVDPQRLKGAWFQPLLEMRLGFNPCTLNVISWFQPFAFSNATCPATYRLDQAGGNQRAHALVHGRHGGAVGLCTS